MGNHVHKLLKVELHILHDRFITYTSQPESIDVLLSSVAAVSTVSNLDASGGQIQTSVQPVWEQNIQWQSGR